MEFGRLSYLRQIERKIQAADYTTQCEQLGDRYWVQNEAKAVRLGRLFVSPSRHLGGNRYTQQYMHDVIATLNQLGHPDIF